MRKLYCLICLVFVLLGCRVASIDHNNNGQRNRPTPPPESPLPTEVPPVLPMYLGYVMPDPGSTLSLEEFQTAAGPSSGSEFVGPGICFSMLEPLSLMRVGDFPTLEQFVDRINVKVDGQVIEEYRSLRSSNLLGIENRDAESGELLWRTPDGMPFHICFETDLGVGKHTVTISIKKPGSTIENYTWSFIIRE